MNPFRTIILSLALILLSSISTVAGQQSTITMNLPESVIREAVQKTLPLYFKVDSGTLLGSISIDKIDNLKLKKNILSSRITLSGHELNLVTSIAGHDIRMKIGSLTLEFQCDTTIRFDRKTQTLYLRPMITEIQQGATNKTDIASTLMLLLNNRELPLRLEKLKPILADTGNKILNISMHIANIQIHPQVLQIGITPTIGVHTKKARKKP